MPERVSCPLCGRPERALTSTGKIKQHDNLTWAAQVRAGKRFSGAICTASGLYLSTALTLAEDLESFQWYYNNSK